jgi:excisionase family DNA binding protein
MNKYVFCSEQELKELVKASVKDAIQKAQSIWQTSQEDKDEILNATQAAKLLNIAKPTLYSKTSKQEIPFFKRGKKLLFRKSELIQWIENGKHRSQAELDQVANDYLNSKNNAR